MIFLDRLVCKHKSTLLLLKVVTKQNLTRQFAEECLLRSSGPVSYGYSELENNNQMSLTTSMVGDMSLQTPNVEYSSTSIKKEILVSRTVRWISASHLYLQSPGDAPGKVTRRKMVDKGQVTDDISLTVSAQSLSDVTGTLMACLHDPPPT